MDLTRLATFPPWQWPPDIGNTLLAVLGDRKADESQHLLAAEMAGEIVAINDDLAGVLLSIVADATASDELRSRAALSLGPVLEQMDRDSIGDIPGLDDELDDQPISEHTFHRIQQALRARYLEDDIPNEVRRRILEASVRAPADWHRDAVRERRTPVKTAIGGSRPCSPCSTCVDSPTRLSPRSTTPMKRSATKR